MGMQIPREIYDCWKQVADKFKFLHQGTDDERREATKRGVQTIRARFRGQSGELDGTRWVAKSQHNTGWSAQSKDALAYVEDGPVVTGRNARMSMFDMINGGSRETNPYPISAHNHEETPPNDNAYILVPDDYDWISDTSHDPSVPPPTTDLEARVAKLESQVTKQQRTIEEHESRIKFLEDNPAGGLNAQQVNQMIQAALAPLSVSVATNWGHGHKADLLGRK